MTDFNDVKVILTRARVPKAEFIIMMGALLAAAVLDIFLPLQTGAIIDILPKRDLGAIIRLIMAIAIVQLLDAAIMFVRSNYQTSFVQRFSDDLSTALFERVQRLPLSYFASHPMGETINRVTGDVEVLSQGLGYSIIPLASAILAIVVTLFAMLSTNWRLSLATLAFLPLWVIALQPGRDRLSAIRHAMASAGDAVQTLLTERLSYSGVLRAKSLRKYAQESTQYRSARDEVARLTRLLTFRTTGIDTGLNLAANVAAPTLTLSVGAWLVFHGAASAGMIVAFLGLQNRLFSPINNVLTFHVRLRGTLAVIRRIAEMLQLPLEQGGNKTAEATSITATNVTFTYSGRRILSDVCFSIDAGDAVAIIGGSGEGKTTIASLILGLYAPTSGSLRVGGIETSQWDLTTLRTDIGYVPQADGLFSGTVEDNLRYGRSDITTEDIMRTLEFVNMAQTVQSMPLGLQTPIGNQGYALSGGERQRLAIARTLLDEPKILILDEATSSIDESNESRILYRIRRMLRNGILIVVTHRLKTTQYFDRVLELRAGTLLEVNRPHGCPTSMWLQPSVTSMEDQAPL